MHGIKLKLLAIQYIRGLKQLKIQLNQDFADKQEKSIIFIPAGSIKKPKLAPWNLKAPQP